MRPGSAGTLDSTRLLLLSLILLSFGLRVYHLDYQSLWRDEVDAVLFARRDLSSLAPLFTSPGHNGPLYYTILHFWIRLVGDSEFGVRSLSLVSGVLALPVLFLLGRRWVGERGALLAALLCAVSPYLIWYSQEGKMYALLFLVSMASTQVYLLALERDRAHLWSCYLLLTAASLYVHLLAVLILPFHLLLFLVSWPRYRRAWKSWLVTFLLLGLPYLPLARWEIALLVRPFTTGHQFYALHEILSILLFSFSLNVVPRQNALLMTLFIFLLLAGLFLYVRKNGPTAGDAARSLLGRHHEGFVLGLHLFGPVISLFLVSLGMPIFTDRYLITVVPAFLLLLACGLLVLRERSSVLAMGCLALVLVAELYVVTLQGHTRIKSDFRAAAQYVSEDGPGELVVFLIPQVRQVFDYYYDDEFAWADAPYTNGGLESEGVAREMEQMTAGRQGIWFVVSEAELWDERGLVEEWLKSNGTLLEQRHFARVDVYLYALKPETAQRREGLTNAMCSV